MGRPLAGPDPDAGRKDRDFPRPGVRREVKVGLRNGEEAQILEGIDENAYVVTSGNRSLTSGENVMVLKRTGGLL